MRHQIDGSLFQYSGPNAVFDIVAAASLEDYGIDSLKVEQVRKHEAGRTSADNSDLRVHGTVKGIIAHRALK